MPSALQISCITKHYYPETHDNFKQLCSKLNIAFSETNEATCCGLPYFDRGELKAAKNIAEYNLQVFGQNDLICNNSKCLNCYQIQYPKIFNNTVSHNSATHLAKNSKGLNTLFEKLNSKHLESLSGHYFLVKDCCRTEWINSLVNQMTKCTWTLPTLKNTCCGAGSSMASESPEVAKDLSKILISEFEQSGAIAMVFEDDICRKQVDITANTIGIPVKTINIVDLLMQNHK
jgi:Fe-S oxidoreductase